MNKKLNTVFFILGGTIVNLLLALIFIGLLLVGVTRLEPVIGQSIVSWVPFAFLGGILIAMIIYQRLSKWAVAKFNLGDKMEPLFTIKRKRNLD